MIENIYHITTRAAWVEAMKVGEYTPASVRTEGFVHCSSARQVISVANTFYSHAAGLVLLEIDPSKLVHEIKWQPGADNPAELFPHLFGALNLDAVIRISEFVPGEDGSFTFPWIYG